MCASICLVEYTNEIEGSSVEITPTLGGLVKVGSVFLGPRSLDGLLAFDRNDPSATIPDGQLGDYPWPEAT